MLRVGWLAIALLLLLPQTESQAATVKVTGADPRESITITVDDATVDVVLEDLRKRYGFEVRGLENARKGEPQTMTMSGSLQSIIERLLRNWNHMIVRSPDNESGIAKVTILNATYGAAPVGAGRMSKKSNDKLLQALTGEGFP